MSELSDALIGPPRLPLGGIQGEFEKPGGIGTTPVKDIGTFLMLSKLKVSTSPTFSLKEITPTTNRRKYQTITVTAINVNHRNS